MYLHLIQASVTMKVIRELRNGRPLRGTRRLIKRPGVAQHLVQRLSFLGRAAADAEGLYAHNSDFPVTARHSENITRFYGHAWLLHPRIVEPQHPGTGRLLREAAGLVEP